MSNPLFNQFSAPNNQMSAFIKEIKEFQQTFNGDPKQEVQKLLNSGKISQQQFNQYAQMANQIMPFLK